MTALDVALPGMLLLDPVLSYGPRPELVTLRVVLDVDPVRKVLVPALAGVLVPVPCPDLFSFLFDICLALRASFTAAAFCVGKLFTHVSRCELTLVALAPTFLLTF